MSKSKNFLEFMFGSKTRVKILKFLFRNPDAVFNAKELTTRVQEPSTVVKKEIINLLGIGLLKIKK